MQFQIWVDSDSVPKSLRTIVLRTAKRLDCVCVFCADRPLADVAQFIADDTHEKRLKAKEDGTVPEEMLRTVKSKVRMSVVTTGANSADDFIVQNCPQSSLCITHDIPLAARLLEKGCTVIDDRGDTYTNQDIKVRLTSREVNTELRSWGVFSEQQKKTSTLSSIKAFADNLDKTVSILIRKSN